MPELTPLPVESSLPELLAALEERGAAVLRAPTGSGKTTRLPPALVPLLPAGRQWVVLEPRRVAARAAAARVAAEQGWTVGREVGHHVRFDRRASDETRLLFATEGILLRRLVEDPLLEGIGGIVFDEFHERNLDADLALALAAQARREVRPDLLLVAMSATLEPGPLAAFLDDAPVVESAGRGYPVTIRWTGRPVGREPRDLATAVARGVGELWEETPGDLLAFLPGLGEIRAAEMALQSFAEQRGARLVVLHGELPAAEQDAVLGRAPWRRIVLATNVAESSITVPGVTAVIDTGLVRRPRFDPGSGLDRLELVRISRAAAEQRAGRAGREQPGLCLRLWPEIEQASLPARDVPEVARVDLAGAALQLLAAGETDLARFPWFEAPSAESLARALALLDRLGARDGRGLTGFGRTLARFPVPPRIGALVAAGHRRGVLVEAALLAAMLSDRPPFRRLEGHPGERTRTATHLSRSDLLDRLDVLERFERTGREPGDTGLGRLLSGPARALFSARDRLVALAREHLGRSPAPAHDRDEALLRCLVEAFPDRVARRREPGGRRGVLVGGRGVVLAPESAVTKGELFLAVDIEGSGPEARVRLASEARREWLPEALVHDGVEVELDPAGERVRAFRRRRYEDLVLDEREVSLAEADPEEVGRRLEAAALADPERALGGNEPAVASLRARVEFLRHARPDLGLPALDGEVLRELLRDLIPGLCAGRKSFAELRSLPLVDFLRGRLDARQLAALDAEAPERLEVPSGSRIAIEYRGAELPILAVRIQELFGLAETPRLAGGRVPVLLHLLAPNYRPQQVTTDLASFWSTTYPEVRRELAGRYPKHSWPSDPRSATAERRPRRKT